MRSIVFVVGLLALVAAACGGQAPGGPSVAGGDGEQVPRCDELAEVEPPEGSFGDAPVYVGNEQPLEEVRAWAEDRPGFAEIWIDRDHNGWLVVGFTQGVADARAEAAERFPDDGVAVVEVERGLDELLALQEQVHQRSTAVQGSSSNVRLGRVELHVPHLTDEVHTELSAEFAGEPVCVSGGDPADAPADGPQPTEGDGWRLLVAEKGVAPPFRTGIATTPEQVDQALATAGVRGADVRVDLEREVLVWFGAPYGSSCDDLRLDGVEVTGPTDDPLLVADVTNGAGMMACTSDLVGAWAFVVAVERSMLPAGPFTIQLDDRPPVQDEATRVEADLSEPGATATDDQLTIPPPDPRDFLPRSGDVVESGYPTEYLLDIDCGAWRLGELNGVFWVTDEADGWTDGLPDAWKGLQEGDEIVVEVLLEEGDPPTLTATANGHSVTYVPGEPDPDRCGTG